ncbi:MAG: methionine--tRNA ligase [Planctomycetota bacterium]|jgi:methionyl-tRNA synthetase
MSRHLVTSALPYANGPIHFGHAIGAYLPADVYVRFLRQKGEEVLFVCGTDEHGVAITIGAEAKGQEYGEYVAHWRDTIKRTFDSLGIEFDHWSGTSALSNHAEFTQGFFRKLVENGYFFRKESEQLYSESAGKFLADRYVIGTCPNCQYEEARGDECPRCGSWLDALKLGDPRSKVDGSPLVKRTAAHWYLDLPKLREEHLDTWIREHEWKPNVKAFLEGLLSEVPARAMTRDMSWGVPVPADVDPDAEGKVLYVWFDAPIGYVSLTAEWAERAGNPDAWRDWWCSEDTRLVHFIGKDNIPFHCLIFPGMLWGQQQGYTLPAAVPAMEFYNLQGKKFSTSGGWSIDLEAFFQRYDAEAARFYLLFSAPETADSEWTWEGFQSCVNAQLADKIGNLITRVLRFASKHWEGQLPPCAPELEAEFDQLLFSGLEGERWPQVGAEIERYRFRRAAQALLELAAVGNVFIDRSEPWKLRKSDPERAAAALRTAAEWIGLLARWMAPLMPGKAQAIWEMLGQPGRVAERGWPGDPEAGAWRHLEQAPLGEIAGLFDKLEDADVAAEVEDLERRSRQALQA